MKSKVKLVPKTPVDRMVADLTERFAAYPDVVFEADVFRYLNRQDWGIRASYADDRCNCVVSMFTYHSQVITQAQVEEVAKRLTEEGV